MKSISLNMTSVEIKAETRALRTTWSSELAKDLEIFTGIDNSSFERYIAKEIRRELRKKSINKIFKN